MGIESYFLNLKLNPEKANRKEICRFLKDRGFSVREQRYGSPVLGGCILINKVLLADYAEAQQVLSLQACFSCFDKTKESMAEVASALRKDSYADYAFHGSEMIYDTEADKLAEIIERYTETARHRFVSAYSGKQADLLPNDDFFRKARKLR